MRFPPLLLLAVIAISLTSLTSLSDFIATNSHISASYTLADKGFSCRMCHIGLPSATIYVEESMGILENYRCIVCHASLSSTIAHFRNVAAGPHSTLGCLYCHIVYHVGHQKYGVDTGTRVYGCYGGACHQIVTQDYSPPASPQANFINTYATRVTATSSFNITRYLYFYSRDPLGFARGTYVYGFTDPYRGVVSATYYPSGKRFWICTHCHFTRLGLNETGVTTTYFVIHPDKCYDCHSPSGGPHNVVLARNAWSICGSCHTGIAPSVENSVHRAIGCRCHSTVHISRYNSSVSWAHIYYPPPGVYPTPPIVNLDQWARKLFYDRLNGSALYIPTYAITVDTDTRYLTFAYLLRDGNATRTIETKWLICYNCHFIVKPGASSIDSLGRIPIAQLPSLSLDPHSISKLGLSIETQPPQQHGEELDIVKKVVIATLALIATLIVTRIVLSLKHMANSQP